MTYVRDSNLRLALRQQKQVFTYSDGFEVEKHLLNIIESANDRSTFSQELQRGIIDWPSEYHLSRARHCLVRPLGIRPGDKVLELGCGCGAITRYLGEIGAKVVAVEGSIARARIAAERCRDLENVDVYVDDLLCFETDESFDWVLLIGVLEYAPVYSNEKDPVQHYLRSVARFLSPHGKLVVAIENKLGLKYFNGCSEDHLGVPYFGVQDLYGTKTPRTFGRRELGEQLTAAGYVNAYYYYPFPDYKLPTVVISETGLHDPQFNAVDLLARTHARDYTGSPYRSFDDALAYAALDANGLLSDLANSFLVVASIGGASSLRQNLLAMSFSVNRNPEFAMITTFSSHEDGSIIVNKSPVGPYSGKCYKINDSLEVSHVPRSSRYHYGRQLLWQVLSARARGDVMQGLVLALCPWMDYLVQHARCPSLDPGYKEQLANLRSWVLPGHYIDCTPFNLIAASQGIVYIDDEWQATHDVALGWVVTRSIYQVLQIGLGTDDPHDMMANVVCELCKMKGLNVDENEIDFWLKVELAFQSLVTGKSCAAGPVRSGLKNVTQAIAIYDEQITALRQGVASRDMELNTLAEELTVRDVRMSILNQMVAGNEEQITALRQEVASRDMELNRLAEEVTARDSQLIAFRSSVSWRLTKPIRWGGDAIRGLFRAIRCNRLAGAGSSRGGIARALHRAPGGAWVIKQWGRLRRYRDNFLSPHSNDVSSALAELAQDRSRTLSTDYHRDTTLARKAGLHDGGLPNITLSVVLYNSKKWLGTFVESLLAVNYPLEKVTVIFVDNGSTDGTMDYIHKFIAECASYFYRIELISSPNLGYGAGNDAALRKSVDEFVLITNVDVEFAPLMLRTLVQVAVADLPEVACWEPMQIPYEHPKYYDPVTLLTNWCSHACVLIRRTCYLSCGGYEKSIFMYGEDVELSFRLRAHGFKLRYVPSARIRHHIEVDPSAVATSKHLLQLSGSLSANILLRYRYGSWRDVLVGEAMLRALRAYTLGDADRAAAVSTAIRAVNRQRLRYLMTRQRTKSIFPFVGFDFDLTRAGAQFRRKADSPMPECPRVSIITRTMKHRWWILSEAITSVINQTYPNIELIVVEDGSAEFETKIADVARLYGFRVQHLQSTGGGRSGAGNVGLGAASGDFILFLDDDDLLFADHVETLVERLVVTPEAIGAYSLAWSVPTNIDWHAKRYREISYEVVPALNRAFDDKRILVQNFAPIQAVLFRRKAYDICGGFNESLHVLEDWNLWCRYAVLGTFSFVEKVTSLYRIPADLTAWLERQRMFDAAYEAVSEVNRTERERITRGYAGSR